MTNELKFKIFLNNHLALGAYIDNRRSQCSNEPVFDPTLFHLERYIIPSSFIWRRTLEGFDFWNELDNIWRNDYD